MKVLGFYKIYFARVILLFITEALIGTYLHDSIVRPYGGDFLVVILIYCFIKSFVALPVGAAALATLLFAYAAEVSQYFKLVARLGLKDSKWANVLLGNSFSWTDMLMYTLGILLVVLLEKIYRNANIKKAWPSSL